MDLVDFRHLDKIPKLKLAVIGHVEWVKFLKVDQLPKRGQISHSSYGIEEPAGGGALIAVEMRNIVNSSVHFFTALGRDSIGEKCYQRLETLGLTLHVGWRNSSTREGISFVDNSGDRAITVMGERLEPNSMDNLPWEDLNDFDGVFITAGDVDSIRYARKAKFLAATPRLGIGAINKSKIKLDALVGSDLDPGEKYQSDEIQKTPKLLIKTRGAEGGIVYPTGRFKSIKLDSKPVDTYGCGDKFAAGFTVGMAASWDIVKALSLGAHCGAKCATYFGPYTKYD